VWATYILGPLLTLLPRPWREKVFRTTPNRLARAALLSGLIEFVFALVGLVVWYSIFVSLARDAISHSSAGVGAPERLGLFAYIWFWFNPITWLVAYFILEGIARSTAALSTGESYGTLPLFLLERVYRLAARPGRTTASLPLVSDEITTGDANCDMKIASCRAKTEWKYPFTIRYSGAYFQVIASVNLGAGPRPFVYSMRRLPPGEIARGLKEYHPADVLSIPQCLARVER
jgi:hypothetical protein